MSILAWIEDQKRLKVLNAPKYVNLGSDSSKGLWTRCDKCGVILYIKHLKENQRVCFGCSYHLQMSSQERIENLLDKDSWRPLDETVSPCDPLEFHDQKNYTDRLQDAQEKTGLQDAIQTGTGMVDQIPVALGVMDFSFMGGSMGSVVGEKLTRLIEYATQEGLTLLIVSASGGARMQEGVFSLMQMAKISSALQIYQSCANLLYISILTSPTTGGVTASFAMLGDIIFAEPKALIAFAGRRVIEQTLREDLPDDFQTSEYMLHHGLIDLIVPRRFLRQALSETIRLYQNAPFKKIGRIPFGVQNPISFLTEEKVRRKWGALTSQKDKKFLTTSFTFDGLGNGNDYPVSQQLDRTKRSLGKLQREDQNLLTLSKKELFDKMRQSIEYREILTSFEMIFNLFSRENYTNFQNIGLDLKNRTIKNYGNQDSEIDPSKNRFDKNQKFSRTDSRSKHALQKFDIRANNLRYKDFHNFLSVASKKALTRIPLMNTNRSLSQLYPNTILFLLSSTQKKAIYAKHNLAENGKDADALAKQKEKNNLQKPDQPVEIKDANFVQNKIVKRFVNEKTFHNLLRQNTAFYVPVMHVSTKQSFNPPMRQGKAQTKISEVKLENSKVPQPVLLHEFRSLSEKFAINSYKQLHFFNKNKTNGALFCTSQTKQSFATSLSQYKNLKRDSLQTEFRAVAPFACNRKTNTKSWVPNGVDSQITNSTSVNTTVYAPIEAPLHSKELETNSNVNASLNRESNRSSVGIKSTNLSNFEVDKNRHFVENNGAIANKVTIDQTNLNFLNQAIELAATESVEWRAFYLHQQIAKTTGFLEDFVQPAFDTYNKQQENLLFYRSICRSCF